MGHVLDKYHQDGPCTRLESPRWAIYWIRIAEMALWCIIIKSGSVRAKSPVHTACLSSASSCPRAISCDGSPSPAPRERIHQRRVNTFVHELISSHSSSLRALISSHSSFLRALISSHSSFLRELITSQSPFIHGLISSHSSFIHELTTS